mmetsp:Transcript_7136/g.31392  ORF Transcript_7136/g.31392 Transcript_7136/m.31392 type:complete len:215 (-) Transcript_7136:1733-2377(-)
MLLPPVLDSGVDNLNIRGIARAHSQDQIIERNNRAFVSNLDVSLGYRLNKAAHMLPLCDNLAVGGDGIREPPLFDLARVAHEHGLRCRILEIVLRVDYGDVEPLLLVVVQVIRARSAGDAATADDDVHFGPRPFLLLCDVDNLVDRGVFPLENLQRGSHRRLNLLKRPPKSLQHPVVQTGERVFFVRQTGVSVDRLDRRRRRLGRDGKFERGGG